MQKNPMLLRSRLRAAPVLAVLLATGVLAGCVVEPSRERVTVREPGVVIAERAPPAPRYEVQPPPPNERVVWDPGRWNWDGRDYGWVPGHYMERPRQNARWEPGRWEQRNGGFVWVEGTWR
jgi:hypothetical protein